MTVLSELSKIAYIGSSSQTLYPIPFEYINTDDIKVSIYTSNNEFVEDWTYSVQYVIDGGNVKVLSGYNIDNTKKLLVLRRVDLVQDNKYREGGDFPAKSTETSFDKLTMITQQLQETLDRCVKVEVLDIQSPEELLQTVYDKLDSATEIAGDAISAANQAQTAADNATAAVNSAEQTLVQTQAYVDSAKVEINNTKNTAINTINSTVAQAKSDINTAVSNAESNISTIVSDAEGSITNIAVTEANKTIANAAQEATDMAKSNVNSYVDGTILPPLQNYVNQAQSDANSASTSMEQAALSATAASNYASNASSDADNAAESAGQAKGYAQNAATSANLANIQNKITNCITEIPQDIKLELKDGTLTLKAGSKVYVPNGVGKFDEVNISIDQTYSNNFNGTFLVFTTTSSIFIRNISNCFSGAPGTIPTFSGTGAWYDTTNNLIKISSDGGSTWTSGTHSLPIAIITISGGAISSIDQVFNGFGYIGSTIFALPGVKGLIPNGRNADGSLKNEEFTVGKVLISTNNTIYSATVVMNANSVNQPDVYTYNTKTNYNEYNGSPAFDCIIGQRTSDSGGKIASFTPKTAFHAVDYQDVPKLATDNTFTGSNTFNGLTYSPTPPTTDNSNQIATTAFFRNNMQVVSSLPSSPVSGVFYFVKE